MPITPITEENPIPKLLTEKQWRLAIELTNRFPNFNGFIEAIRGYSKAWKEFIRSDNPMGELVPGEFTYSLKPFEEILFYKVMRPEKIVHLCKKYVSHSIGNVYTVSPPATLD